MPLPPAFLAALERTLPPAALIREPERLRTYECDALTGHRAVPVLAADVVLPDGELVTLSRDDEGPDLLGVFVGSEGTLGITVRITVRILRAPETVRTLLAGFPSTGVAGEVVSRVISAGILPAAI